jgi:hypothetical protein
MLRITDSQRVELLPKVLHGKKLQFTGREIVE